jgi:hypothetical protein
MNDTSASARQPLGKSLGQIWGILLLLTLFSQGGYRLLLKGIDLFDKHALTSMDYFIFGVLFLFGAVKGEVLFRRVFITRTLARAREALGETGWSGDYWLAPFCMLSLYRPWQRKHQIMSLVLVPVMVGLAVYFAVGNIEPVFKGAVDLAIGFALCYAALFYLIALVRVFVWWLAGARLESCPLPAWAGPKPLRALTAIDKTSPAPQSA